jgi:hypothetical protein
MTRNLPKTLFGAALVLASATAWAQTQQQLDAQGTQIEVRESYRSDSSGAASSVETNVKRADGSGKHIGQEDKVTVSPAPPVQLTPPAGSTTTTTTTINRQ